MSDSPEQLHRDFESAFNRHDLFAILVLYAPDAVLISGNRQVEGLDAIREAYQGVLAARPRIELRTAAVFRAGDIALLHGAWTLYETAPDGSTVRREGRSAETARREPDGRWLYVIDNPNAPMD